MASTQRAERLEVSIPTSPAGQAPNGTQVAWERLE